MKTKCYPPGQFSDAELGRFAEMVISGGEVCADGLDGRIRAAAFLVFLYDRDDVLCGVAAIKQPDADYRNGVFAKAEASFDPATYALELGWVVVAEKYRGHGLTANLLTPLIKRFPGEPIYATTRIGNEPMRRSLVRYGFQSDGTHYLNKKGDAFLVLHLKSKVLEDLTGPFRVRGQFHGSKEDFDSFETNKLKSLGFHFGDIVQALHFATGAGFIYHADLTFKNCLDIRQDWGWTSAQHVALALNSKCWFQGIAHENKDFEPILGPAPWSQHTFTKTDRISEDEQRLLKDLFTKCGFDGVRYVNKWEPLGSVNRVAYFVIDPAQISFRGKKQAGAYKI
jgi:predicted GNAT family N-acyltransferase